MKPAKKAVRRGRKPKQDTTTRLFIGDGNNDVELKLPVTLTVREGDNTQLTIQVDEAGFRITR